MADERTTTTNLGLILPQYDETADIADINTNMETLDSVIHDLLVVDDVEIPITWESSVSGGYEYSGITSVAKTGYRPIAVVGWEAVVLYPNKFTINTLRAGNPDNPAVSNLKFEFELDYSGSTTGLSGDQITVYILYKKAV